MSFHRFPTPSLRSVITAAAAFTALAAGPQLQAVSAYSNSTNYLNAFTVQGTTLAAGTEFVTPLQADDLLVTPGAGGQVITSISFGVANNNANNAANNVSVVPLIRVFAADGTNGNPGTLLGSFAAVVGPVAGKNYQRFTVNVPEAQGVRVPLNGKLWLGVAYITDTRATATQAQVANFGLASCNPPTLGKTANIFFLSNAGGTYSTNNPSGTQTISSNANRSSFSLDLTTAALGPVNVTETTDPSTADVPGTLRYANAVNTASIPIEFRLSGTSTIALQSALSLQTGPTKLQLPEGTDVTISSGVAAGVITGSRALSITGPGTIRFTGANTYSGGTTLSGAASVGIGHATGLGSGSIPVTADSTIFATGAAITAANNSAISSGVKLSIGDSPQGPQALTLNGVISSTGGLVMKGSGLLTLGGNNTFSGGLTLNSGTTSVATAANLGSTTNALTFSGGALRITGTTLTTLAAHPVNATTFTGGIQVVEAANTFTLGTPLSGAGMLTKSGAGTLVLTGANPLTGGVVLTEGILAFTGSGMALGSSAPLTVNGGTFVVPAASPFAIGALQGSGGSILNASVIGGSATPLILSVGNGGTTGTYAGVISDAAGNSAMGLEKNGIGTQTLSAGQLYTGPTQVKAGTLILGGNLANTASVTIDAGAALTFTASGAIGSGTNAAPVTNNGTLTLSSGTLSIPGGVTNSGTIKVGAGATLDASVSPAFTNDGVIDAIEGTVLLPPGFVNGVNGIVVRASDLRISEITRSGATVSVKIASISGRTYRLQKSTDLVTFTDTSAAAQAGSNGTTLTFTDTEAAEKSFYRVRVD